MAYVEFPLSGEDPDDLLTEALARIADRFPSWTPRETHLEYALLSEMVREAADTRLLAADVADAIFRAYGEKLIGIPPLPGVPASGSVEFTFVDTDPHSVPAGTQVLWPAAGDPVLFQTTVDVTNTTGSAVTPAVQVVAVTPGTAGNGLSAVTLQLVDSISFVTSAAGTTGTSGGSDPESDGDFLDRLSDDLRLLRRIPVLGDDYAVLVRNVPGVFRALALDGYDPDTGTSGNERTVAIASLDAAGADVSSGVAADVDALVQSTREVNFVIKTMGATRTAVTVAFTALAVSGADTTAVHDLAVARLMSFLSPAAWGGGTEKPPVWRPEPTVRYLDVSGVLYGTPGLAHVVSLTLNGGTGNVTLTGVAPLPTPTVTGTVT